MGKGRLEAFSDGVLAIIITIMVLEVKVPHGVELTALRPLIPVFLSYGLSFIYLGIYWSNHHHMLYVAHGVNGAILWANLHLLFWLSLVPFVTGWMGENRLAPAPTAVYGVILLLAAIAYWLLQQAILRQEGPDSTLGAAVGSDRKGKTSDLCHRDSRGVSAPVDGRGIVCGRRPDVARSGPPNRAESLACGAGGQHGRGGMKDRASGEVDA